MTLFFGQETEDKRAEKELIIKPHSNKYDDTLDSIFNSILASFNLITHEIDLRTASEEDTVEGLWHEQLHKLFWEDKDVPEETTRLWDNIAYDISEYLELPKRHYFNWKKIKEMVKDSPELLKPLYQPTTEKTDEKAQAKARKYKHFGGV